ncbi:MAG: hypothetical protein EAZ99_11000 [Alphaproteobacteria bacterium]|nr:MAG: hypothetical protein EAZ99_11000 [Alphaproteobacteria bacterium]
MGRSEWILIGVMVAIALAAMLSGGALEGTVLGLLLAGEPLPERPAITGTAQVVGALSLMAVVVFLLAQTMPQWRDFLRTGSIVLLIGAILAAVFDSL